MAIHIREDPADDVWSIFVRNWGDQGYCSSTDWQWSQTTVTFEFPMVGAASTEILWDSHCDSKGGDGDGTCFLCRGNGGGRYVETLPGQGAKVTFTLPAPNQHERINGELHLKWTVETVPKAVQRPFPPTAHPPQSEGEDNLSNRALKRMSPAQKAVYLRSLPPHGDSFDAVTVRPTLNPTEVLAASKASRTVGAKMVPAKIDPIIDAARSVRIEALRKAFGGSIPEEVMMPHQKEGSPRKPVGEKRF